MDAESDKNLVASCKAGDKSAYALLVERHYKSVYLTCLGMLSSTHDAEDIAQDAMLKGLKQLGKLRNGSAFGSWITKIAKNMCINHMRRQKPCTTLTENLHEQEKLPAETERLQQALQKLAPEFRLPLVMYYFNGQSVKSVAQKLNISTSTVYIKLRNAIKQLQNLLSEQE